jgi:two-component system NtrC family sensor kinase
MQNHIESSGREQQRLAALARYQIVDTLPELTYDDIALLAAEICEVPISLISLVEQDRQWFKSVVGLEVTETSRAVSFCAHALNGEGVLQVQDSLQDERFARNELVLGEPGIRFYAGAPLRTPDGYTLGTLCVIDRVPRTLAPQKLRALEALARQVMIQLELRHKAIEIEKASTALRQTEKLAAVGRLASAISHEINNPLQSVTNLLYMAENSSTGEQTRSYVAQAQEELARVTHVVTQTLRFHKQSEFPVPIALNEIVDNVVLLFRARFLRRRITLHQRNRSTTQLVCYAADLRQVIANLVSNAMDAAESDESIFVRVQDVGHCVVLTIADTGSGMSEETQRRLFEAFYTTKGVVGTGLGLWVSKGILDKHQAHISVRSSQRAGKSGTVFRISFPRVAALAD